MVTLAEQDPDMDSFQVMKIPPLGVQYQDELLQGEGSGSMMVSRQSRYNLYSAATQNPEEAFRKGFMSLTVLGAIPPDEAEELQKMPDMLNAVMAWIIESITVANVSGDLSIPGPILS